MVPERQAQYAEWVEKLRQDPPSTYSWTRQLVKGPDERQEFVGNVKAAFADPEFRSNLLAQLREYQD